ncbi:MAG: type IX secretion system membrane protein PorP/SprF, partial [Flavobacteriales bacterium]|nr:type IX secretion system membrane protein PorP/SprF [Flavobacteriales bacterium]
MSQGFSMLNKASLKHLFTMLLLFLGVFNFVRAQDPVFTQFYSNPVYLNPAFSGSNKCPRLVSNYRDQWPGFSGNFITTAVAYDQSFDALKGGFGLVILSDQ